MTHEGENEARKKFLGHFQRDSSFREHIVYSLSYAGNSLESDLESDSTFPLIDDRMKRQLNNSYNALLSHPGYDAQELRSRLPPQLNLGSLESLEVLAGESIKRKLPPLEQEDKKNIAEYYEQPLPTSINQISPYKLDGDARAIVITDTKNPYHIVAVNTAWENLCGYTREECQGHPLGRLLQGPETDMSNVSTLLSKLLAGEEARTILTNYSKHGRKFQNNIRVGPIVDEMGKTINFVGVLREVEVDEDHFSSFSVERRMQLPFMS